MRLRRKPWARPELAESYFFVDEPTLLKNKWQQEFNNSNPIYMELGCGKGVFIATEAQRKQDVNFIAIDLKSEVLVLAKRCVEKNFSDNGIQKVENVRLMSQDIERLDNILGEEDKISRIYINFCNPWPKPRHEKHRLTYPKQLLLYKNYLVDDGEIWFKTDDENLFEASLLYFDEAGYNIKYITRDLHNSDFTDSPETEHERMFTEKGIPTKFLIATKK